MVLFAVSGSGAYPETAPAKEILVVRRPYPLVRSEDAKDLLNDWGFVIHKVSSSALMALNSSTAIWGTMEFPNAPILSIQSGTP